MKTAETIDEVAFDPITNMARQTLYHFASRLFGDPKRGAWDQLFSMQRNDVLTQAAMVLREFPNARAQTLGHGERAIRFLDPEPVVPRLPGTPEEFNVEYERAFGLLAGGRCPPYETEFIGSKFAFQRSNTLADVSGFYRAFGLTIAADYPERPDHICIELEFMARLLSLERQAATSDAAERNDRLCVCREAQIRFVTEHLAWWAPAFARVLGHECPGGFYDAAASFLSALIPVERRLLGIDVPVRHAAPATALDLSEACAGCQDSA